MAPQRYWLPVETMSSLVVIGVLGVATTFGLSQWQLFQNWGKPKRFSVDTWDRNMMERDSRLSGNVNRQRFEAVAPESFKSNSAWPVEKPLVS